MEASTASAMEAPTPTATLEASAPTALEAATSTLEAPATCRPSTPARGAACARVTHIATPSKSLEGV